MADKKYTVQMDFIANTSNAQQALRGLQATLAQISSQNVTPGAGMEANIKKASAAASELSIHLKNALNVNTGNIDLSKFNKSLTLSKTSLKSLMTDLVSIGPTGNQAFLELASSIAKAEAPAVRLNSLLTQTWATIKGSLRWEIVTRGLTSGLSKIQEAYNYAKDLNKSLNSIRIVSDESADSMARFAKQANAAAKELRSTTLDYTDSALIYFQQGLGMSDVLERTDVTVKMANVVGESAQTVSDQLTAIWNNFDDGSKNVEYFADVLTKLGADTASSTDEIAQGLEKFASVAKDVGLSYEYATAALTTITATTRQSADVVGTALKTIFSRMQGLKLGDTLEDGTTLNDYSKALLAVGVNIKDDNGELKDMDVILDEVGAKWATLGKDQRVALAQQVAGIRQYNQFISLMSNYDFFKENVQRAMNATGTLNEQNEIYKESWEAASKSVKASIQGIYDSIIDDKWIIKATNNVAEFISGIDQFVDSIGGLKTIIPAIGSIFLMMFANKIPEAIQNIGYNLGVVSGKAYKDASQIYTTTKNQITQQLELAEKSSLYTEQETLSLKTNLAILEVKEKLTANQKDLTNSEKEKVNYYLQELKVQEKLLAQIQEKKNLLASDTTKKVDRSTIYFGSEDMLEAEAENNGLVARQESLLNAANVGGKGASAKRRQANQIENFYGEMNGLIGDITESLTQQINKVIEEWRKGGYKSAEEFNEALNQVFSSQDNEATKKIIEQQKKAFNQFFTDSAGQIYNNNSAQQVGTLQKELEIFIKLNPELNKNEVVMKALTEANKKGAWQWKDFQGVAQLVQTTLEKLSENGLKKTQQAVEGANGPMKNVIPTVQQLEEALKRAKESFENYKNAALEAAQHTVSFSQTLSSLAGSAGSLIFGFNNLKGAWDALTNSDLTWGKRMTEMFTSLIFSIPMVIGGFNQMGTTLGNFQKSWKTTKKNLLGGNLATLLSGDGLGLRDDSKAALLEAFSKDGKKGALETLEKLRESIDPKEFEQLSKVLNSNIGIVEIFKTKMIGLKTAGVDTAKAIIKGFVAMPLPAKVAIAAIVAVGTAAHLAYKYVEENSPEAIYKREAAALENYTSVTKEAKQAQEELFSKVNSYEENLKSLDELTKGTQEYQNALNKVNDEAKELLKLYPELAASYKMENGAIAIDKEALNNAKNKAQQETKKAEAVEAQQRRITNEAEMQKNFSAMDDKFEKYDNWTTGIMEVIGGAITGAIVGNVPGAIAGAAVGIGLGIKNTVDNAVNGLYDNDGIMSAIANNANSEEIQAQLAANSDNATKQLEILNAAGINLEEFGFKSVEQQEKYLKENSTNILQYLKEYKAILTGQSSRQASLGITNSKDYTQGREFKDESKKSNFQNIAAVIAAIRSEKDGKDLSTQIEEKIEAYEKDGGLKYSNRDLTNVIVDYGENSDTVTKFGLKSVNWNDKNTKKYYKEIFGKEDSDIEGLEDEEMRRQIIAQIITESLGNQAQNNLDQDILDVISKVTSSTSAELGSAFGDALQNAYSSEGGLKNFSWSGILGTLNIEDLFKFSEITDSRKAKEMLLKLLGLTDEEAVKAFGVEGWSILVNSISQQARTETQNKQKNFAESKGIVNSAEGYEKYARAVLKWDDEMIEKKKKLYGNDIIKAVLAENDAIEKAAQSRIDYATSITTTSDRLSELQKIYKDFKEGDIDSMLAKVANDSTFAKNLKKDIGEEEGAKIVEQLQVDLANAKTMAEYQTAFDKAATSIVTNTLKTKDLTLATKEDIEATKEQLKAKLEANGFYADEAFLQAQLAEAVYNSAKAEDTFSAATIEAAMNNGTLAETLTKGVTALGNLGISSEVAANKLAELAYQQYKTSKTQLDFSGQIKSLKDIAKAAGIAILSLNEYGLTAIQMEQLKKAGPTAAGIGVKNWTGLNIAQVEADIDAYFANLTGSYGSNSYKPNISSSKSSGSKDKKDKKEKTDKEFDQELTRYYKLDKLYEKASDRLDDISKAKDRAYGPKHLKFLNQEISATQKLMDINKKYLKQNAEYTKQDLAVFNQKAKGMGLNFSIGSLDNLPDDYEKAEKLAKEYGEKITAEFNAAQAAAVDRYNASAKDTTASEQYDKDLKAAEDTFNKKSKLREEYLDYLGKLDEDAAKKREKERELLEQEISLREKRIEKITYQVEIIGDATEAKETFLDWYKELSPYQKYRVQFEINIDKENFRQSLNDVEDYSKQLEAILKEAGVNASAEDFLRGRISSSDLDKLQDQSIVDAIKEISNNLINSAQKVKESMESITQDYIDGLDRQKDKFQEFSDSIDFVREGYISLFNITELAGGGNKFNKIFDFDSRIKEAKKYLDAETDIRRSALKNQGAELQNYNEMRKQAEIDYNAALASGNAALIEETKKVLDKQTELYRNAYNTWSSGFEDLLNNIFDNFSKKVELMFSTFDKQYNTIKDKFDKTKSLSEDYMDDFQKMYEVNKLNADIQKSINDTKNVKSKQELVALQNKINQKAKEQGKMSEYEVQALRKQYELKLAMQQLEDAQNAKNQVRLTRDAEGNFGYMYTADETEIANAQQNLNDKLYEYYKFNTDRVGDLSETYLDLMSQMEEEIKNLSLKDFESEAAYNQAVERIKDFYMQKMDTIKAEMEQALNNNNELTREYAEAISSLGVNFQMIIDEFKDTNLAQVLGMEDSQQAFDKFNETFFGEGGLINKVKNEAADAFRTLGESINEAATSIGGEGGLTDALKELNNEFGETATNSLAKWADSIITTFGENSKLYKELMKTLPSLSSSFNNVNESVKKLTGGATNAQTGAAGQGTTDYSGVGKDFLNNPRLVKWEALKAAVAKLWGYDAFGTINWARDILRVAAKLDPDPGEPKRTLMDLDANSRIDVNDARFASRVSVKLDDIENEYPKFLDNIWDKLIEGGAKFDTGGYTGAWGNSGRIAMLHEKELVLNSQDTSNLLSSVDILRRISKTLDLQAISARMASSGLLSSVGINNKAPQAVQQDVHISATFPNVSDSREIEEALNNLVNEAVQYTTQQF